MQFLNVKYILEGPRGNIFVHFHQQPKCIVSNIECVLLASTNIKQPSMTEDILKRLRAHWTWSSAKDDEMHLRIRCNNIPEHISAIDRFLRINFRPGMSDRNDPEESEIFSQICSRAFISLLLAPAHDGQRVCGLGIAEAVVHTIRVMEKETERAFNSLSGADRKYVETMKWFEKVLSRCCQREKQYHDQVRTRLAGFVDVIHDRGEFIRQGLLDSTLQSDVLSRRMDARERGAFRATDLRVDYMQSAPQTMLPFEE